MVALQEQKERVGTLLQAAVPMMCRNGLQFTSNFEITALIGIKIDTETFLVSINDTFRTENDEESQEAKDKNSCSESENSAGPSSPKRAKRKRKRSKNMSDKKARQAEEDRSSSESDNEAGPSPAASSRLEAQPVLALEETSLDTAYELNQTIADNQSRKPTASAKVKQENQSGSDSDDLVLVKEENMYNYGNHGDSVGGAEGGFPGGLGNTLQQASTSFGLPPQFHHTNTNSSDLQGDQLMDVSGSHLSQQDPQQDSSPSKDGMEPMPGGSLPQLNVSLTASSYSQSPMQVPPYETLYHTLPDGRRTETGEFRCGVCDMKTRFRQSIQRHMRDKHSGVRHVCTACGAAYSWKISLTRHRKTCSGIVQGTGMVDISDNSISQITRLQFAQFDDGSSSRGGGVTIAGGGENFTNAAMNASMNASFNAAMNNNTINSSLNNSGPIDYHIPHTTTTSSLNDANSSSHMIQPLSTVQPLSTSQPLFPIVYPGALPVLQQQQQYNVHPSDNHQSDTRPSYSHPSDTRPSDMHPSNIHPSDVHPSDTRPSYSHPSDTHPSDTHPSDTHPSDTHPSETHQLDDLPSDVHPSDVDPSKPKSEALENSPSNVTKTEEKDEKTEEEAERQ